MERRPRRRAASAWRCCGSRTRTTASAAGWTPSADAAACGKIIARQQRGYLQDALKDESSLDCLVMDTDGECTCRKTDTIA